jgi:hypothetical protein
MIVGVAARVVPTLNGVDARRLPPLWAPFLLLNFGCAMRVVAQVLTDVTPLAYPVAGASGLLEVLGLAVWGVDLWRIMSGRTGGECSPPAHTPLCHDEPITPAHLVGDVLERHPRLLDEFLSFGFHLLRNPLLRRTLAGRVSIERACRLLDVDSDQLIAALNAARGRPAGGRIPLPMQSVE